MAFSQNITSPCRPYPIVPRNHGVQSYLLILAVHRDLVHTVSSLECFIPLNAAVPKTTKHTHRLLMTRIHDHLHHWAMDWWSGVKCPAKPPANTCTQVENLIDCSSSSVMYSYVPHSQSEISGPQVFITQTVSVGYFFLKWSFSESRQIPGTT